MSHCKMTALALVATGALTITTMSIPASYAIDVDHGEVSQSADAADDAQQTFIVQLEDGAADLEGVRERLGQAVAAATPGATIEYVRDYHHVFEGFALKAPRSALKAIKGVRGVAAAFAEGTREPIMYPEFLWGGSAKITNPAGVTRADQAVQQGQGLVIEVIDTGLDTSHEAFAGSMDSTSLRLTQTDMTSLTASLGAGKGGAWVSDKIPFVYDYADGDTDVLVGYEHDRESYTRHVHGTRMAGLAAANDKAYRGAAPQAQLVVAKVVSDSWNVARDSDLLAALDDAMVIRPDTVAVSFMSDRDISGDAVRLYERAYDRLSNAGMTVVAPAGDYGRAEWRTLSPQMSSVGAPAAYSSVLSVAAVLRSNDQGEGGLAPWNSSSWGVNPDLRLKPEIAAPGGSVTSSEPGNEYDDETGTAEASAQVAGVAALVRQRIATDPAFAAMSAADKNAVVTNLLMGTAHPIVDATKADGAFYSPRRVGAGLVDAVGATTSPVYPSVVGAADSSRPKAELGDGTDGWTFQVQLTNVSDAAHTYTLGGQALSEDVNFLLYTGHATNWTGKGIDLTFSSDSVTVPAKSSATVTITVTPTAEFASFAAEHTPQGTFIDGAVTFTSTDGQPGLTVPYLGFYGAEEEPKIFDSPVYEKGKIGTSTMTFHRLTLGQLNPFDPEESMAISTNDRDLYIITRSAEENARTYAIPATILLRDVDKLTYTYTNETGEVVRSYEYGSVPKSHSYFNGRFTEVTTAEEHFDSTPIFEGYDAAGNELPDGAYTLTIEGTSTDATPTTQQLTHVIRLDTQAPVVSNLTITGEGNERTLSFDVTDSSYIAGYGFSSTVDGAPFMQEKEYHWGEQGEDGLIHYHYDVPISTIAQRSGGDPSTVYLQVWDWPLNKGTVKVDLKAAPKTGEWKWGARGWWYRYEDGSYPSSAALVIDGSTYRFDAAGYMRTGWVKDQGAWYYHEASGAQASGWVFSGARWYYLSPASGVMATGWVQVGSTWYYLSPDSGAMATGWLK
ncbi:S8 family serine peptidase, partial [Actinomyces sp.]